MNNCLLLEILTEEIPYTLQAKAIEDIKQITELALQENLINFDLVNVFATSRRITIIVQNIYEFTQPTTIEKKGPKANIDNNILNAFLQQNNITKDNLIVKEGYYFIHINSPALEIKNIIANIIQNNILSKVKFKKSMHWNSSKVYWARPIVNLLCILEINSVANIINLTYANVQSSNYTFGHRFLGAKNNPIPINSVNNYFIKLKENFVILDQNERKEIIIKQANNIAYKYNASLLNNWVLNEVVFLNEYPVVLESSIPQKYLQLPKELIITIMANNQRYLNIIDNNNNLLPNYIIVANNLTTDNAAEIIKGNNKVLTARLEDGLFFYNQDITYYKNTSLETITNNLQKITYFEDLGTYYDKVTRILSLLNQFKQNNLLNLDNLKLLLNNTKSPTSITEYYSVIEEIIKFCKVDLLSNVVKEIPELQGIMGEYYYNILHKNTKQEAVSSLYKNSIKEHYKPQGPNDQIPLAPVGQIVSLLDKLDTLEQLFNKGKMPTGSQDPYALRRAALGVIRILLEGNFVNKVQNLFNIDIKFNNLTNNTQLQEFFTERFKNYIVDELKISKDIINSKYNFISTYGIHTTFGFFAVFANNTQQASVIECFSLIDRLKNLVKSSNNSVMFNKINNIENIELNINYNNLQTSQEQYIIKVLQNTNITFAQINECIKKIFEIKLITEDVNLTTMRLAILVKLNYLLHIILKEDSNAYYNNYYTKKIATNN